MLSKPNRKTFITPYQEEARRIKIIESDSFKALMEFRRKQIEGEMHRFQDLILGIKNGLKNKEFTVTTNFFTRFLSHFLPPENSPWGRGDIYHATENLDEEIKIIAKLVDHLSNPDNQENPFFVYLGLTLGNHKIQSSWMQYVADGAQWSTGKAHKLLDHIFNNITTPQVRHNIQGWIEEELTAIEKKAIQKRLDDIRTPLEEFLDLFDAFKKEHRKAFKELRKEADWVEQNRRQWEKWGQPPKNLEGPRV